MSWIRERGASILPDETSMERLREVAAAASAPALSAPPLDSLTDVRAKAVEALALLEGVGTPSIPGSRRNRIEHALSAARRELPRVVEIAGPGLCRQRGDPRLI